MTRRVPAQAWHECPKCAYPMVRWEKFQQNPERVWLVWKPEEWWGPVHVLILGGLLLLGFLMPWVGVILLGGQHRRGFVLALIEGVGLGSAVLIGYVTYLRRQRRRKRLTGNLQPLDWVCARCLHTEHERH